MRITEIETFVLKAEIGVNQPYWGKQMWGGDIESAAIYPPSQRLRETYADTSNTVIVKLGTDTGLGPTISSPCILRCDFHRRRDWLLPQSENGADA